MNNDIAIPQLTEAEKNELTIIELAKNIQENFWLLGGLLLENYGRGYWAANGHESFIEFVQMLGQGYSWATRLMDMRRLERDGIFTKEEILEIGPSKMALLLPPAKKGILDEDTRLLARDCTFKDLQRQLRHKVNNDESDEFLICPRCGVEITVFKGMIRKHG